MKSLVRALSTNRSLTTLQLHECELDAVASRLFAEFVRTQCNRPGGNSVRKLMAGQNVERVAANMLTDSTLQGLCLHQDGGT
jgi:hypothetical protein